MQTAPTQRKNKIKLIRGLQQKIRRRDIKIRTMKQLLKKLKQDSDGVELVTVLENSFSGFSLDFIKNQAENNLVCKNAKRYCDSVKEFALTVYFYSPKTYRYLRQHFHLPNDRTLRMWMSNCNCEVGFLTDVLMFLKNEIEGGKDFYKECGLVFDSMSIRKQVVWDKRNDKFVGYVDYGGIICEDTESIATEVLMFQIVSYQQKFKCPIAYFLTNKTSGLVQAQLLKVALIKLHEVGVTIRSLTCDGTVTNFSSLKKLGCDFDFASLKTNFKHPACDVNVHVILDACHMLKLARNAIAECKVSSPEGIISWRFINNLHNIQEEIDLKLANSITIRHVQFQNKKMNVRLAAQVLSSGVADAIEYLNKSGYEQFKGSEATVKFIRVLDKMFDILNSKNPFGRGFKSPLTLKNATLWIDSFEEFQKYLNLLKINNEQILCHTRKTFALGFIITMHSIKNLALELLKRDIDPFKYILTYKFSQDNLETFFSLIRASGGWNNNPNALQLRWALKKLLFKNSVQLQSENANCIADNENGTNSIFKLNASKKCHDNADLPVVNLYEQLLPQTNPAITELKDEILYYISGFVTRQILKGTSCDNCTQILLHLPSAAHCDHTYAVDPDFRKWTLFTSRGGLVLAADVTFLIIRFTEKLFLLQMRLNKKIKNFKLRIVLAAAREFCDKLHLFVPKHPASEEFAVDDVHEIKLVKKIASFYVEMRMKTKAKKITETIQGENACIRQKFNKLILFKNV